MTIARNAARNAEIVKLYTKGGQELSFADIASRLGLPSRNIVAGVLNRAGIATRDKTKAHYVPRPGSGRRPWVHVQ